MVRAMNILEHLIEAHGGTTSALAELNRVTGREYKMNRFYEWRNGKRPLPQSVYTALVYSEAGNAMRASGMKPGKGRIRSVRRRLLPPKSTPSE